MSKGRLLEFAGREFMVRGRGYLKSVADIEQVAVGRASAGGTPVRVGDVARRRARPGPSARRRRARWRGEVVGGIVVMRFGENALRRHRPREGQHGRGPERRCPQACASCPRTTDRGSSATRSHTLRRTLIEEAVVVSLVTLAFLFHFRSALIPIITLPIAVARVVRSDVLPRRLLEHHVARRAGAGDRRARGCLDRDGGECLSPHHGDAGRTACRPCRSRIRRPPSSGPRVRSAAPSSSRWPSSSCRSCRCFCSRRRKAACSGRWRSPRRSRWRRPRCCPSRSCRC